jgi:hypothetical protein
MCTSWTNLYYTSLKKKLVGFNRDGTEPCFKLDGL